MKSLRFVACFLVLGIAAGCASTNVTTQDTRARTEEIAQPKTIYVYPFASTREDISSWTAAAIRYAEPSEPQTAEELATARQLGALVASELVAKITEMGLVASEASSGANPKVNDLMLTGYFESVDAGSTAGRVLLGFGSGSAELRTVVEGYQMSTLGPRLLSSGTVESGGNKTPGLFVPLVVLAATANPIGLAVAGTAKIAGEATGRSKIEGSAKRTASEIADVLRARFQERGWIR
jgi:hypothetical protein